MNKRMHISNGNKRILQIAVPSIIANILRNSDIHRKTGILHSDEPAGKTVKAEHGRSPPDADTKVESGQTFYLVGSLYESKCGFWDGILQSHQTECDKQSHAD